MKRGEKTLEILYRISAFVFLSVGLCLTLGACAGVNYQAIMSEPDDQKARGLRYYDSSPYLLVQTDNQGGITSEFMYLPDKTKKRHAHPYTFLSSNTTTLEFQKGILTNNTSETDSSIVPAAVVKALEQVATSAVKMFDQTTPTPKKQYAPDVYLFKIVKVDGKWGLAGAAGGGVQY
jgi:hypothetical protein